MAERLRSQLLIANARLTRLQTDYVDLYQTHWPDHDAPYDEMMDALDSVAAMGARTLLRFARQDDGPAFLDLLARSREHLTPWMPRTARNRARPPTKRSSRRGSGRGCNR